MSQPPTPPGQPLPQPQPQPWPLRGMQPAADRGVDPDAPTTDAALTPTDDWAPPPWTAGPDARASWTPPPWAAGAAKKARHAGWTDTEKVTVVHEGMFGNTRKVAQAISDGVRKAYPDSRVECVPVGKASAKLIKSTDLLIVGGPTYLRRMTTDSSRKRQISGEKRAEAKSAGA